MRTAVTLTLVVALSLNGAGCAANHLLAWKQESLPVADAHHPVVRMVALWEPSEGTGLDKLPTRGFAGQLLFFTRNDETPVLVDGDVLISLYDSVGSIEQQQKPIHQFHFPPDAWKTHAIKGMLGPCYQLFIPYVRKYPYQVRCSLRVHLKPKAGPDVYSELVHVTLPGPIPDEESKSATEPAGLDSISAALKPAIPPEPAVGATLQHYQMRLEPPSAVESTDKPAALAAAAETQAAPAAAATSEVKTTAQTDSSPPEGGNTAQTDAQKEFLEKVKELEARQAALRTPQAANAMPAAGDSPPAPKTFRLTPADTPHLQSEAEPEAPKSDLSHHPLANFSARK